MCHAPFQDERSKAIITWVLSILALSAPWLGPYLTFLCGMYTAWGGQGHTGHLKFCNVCSVASWIFDRITSYVAYAYTTWGGDVHFQYESSKVKVEIFTLSTPWLPPYLTKSLHMWHTYTHEWQFVAHNFKDERSKIKVTRVVQNFYHGRRLISWLLGETDQLCWYLVAKACRSYEIPRSTDLCYYQNIYPGKKYSLLYQYPFYMLSPCIQSYDDARHCYEYRMWFIHEILLLN